MAYRFGPFLYDPVSHGLFRDGAEIALQRKSRELLVFFLQNPGRLLSREDLIDQVWKDAAVTDDAIRFQVGELRKALGAEGGAFIRTIPREGYRWQEEIRTESFRPVRSLSPGQDVRPEKPRYRLVLETREVQRLEGENVIGRDADAALWIDHPSVSRRHARIVIAGGKATLEDMGSKNGTLLDDKKIQGKVALVDGGRLRVGLETMVFRVMAQDTTRTAGKG